ncbi:hypothetical protein TMatcc_009411 [Talaromyces marneffei ATCC 18224]
MPTLHCSTAQNAESSKITPLPVIQYHPPESIFWEFSTMKKRASQAAVCDSKYNVGVACLRVGNSFVENAN